MANVLLTGGAGFFGSVLKTRLLEAGHRCVSIDLCPDATGHENFKAIRGDIRDVSLLDRLYSEHRFDAVIHCAAVLAHGTEDKRFLWESNVDGTRNVAETARKHGVPKLVFTSSNCLWGESLRAPVPEDQPPNPVEIYGRSKLEGERILSAYSGDLSTVIIRCPTIIDSGRLGLLSILFEFIDEGRKVWVVGGGRNRYQFIYAQELEDSCVMSLEYGRSDVFNIGSDNVKSLREVFAYVIREAGSSSKLASMPQRPAVLGMWLAYAAHLSPLGPYHYKMIAEDFQFDTGKIKTRLGWRPTLTNEQMLYRAYQYYRQNRLEIVRRKDVSAHRQPARMGVIRLLKWVS